LVQKQGFFLSQLERKVTHQILYITWLDIGKDSLNDDGAATRVTAKSLHEDVDGRFRPFARRDAMHPSFKEPSVSNCFWTFPFKYWKFLSFLHEPTEMDKVGATLVIGNFKTRRTKKENRNFPNKQRNFYKINQEIYKQMK
jgi:hypothetical protein